MTVRPTEIVKGIARPVVYGYREARWVRKFRTRGFTTGKLAVGEQNRYHIGRDWITLDLEGADFNVDLRTRTPLPFADGSLQVVYSSHTVEHIEADDARRLLAECRRALAPGGTLRIEAPDAERIVAAYRKQDHAFFDEMRAMNHDTFIVKRGRSSEYGEEHVALLGYLSCYIEDGCHVPVIAPKGEVDRRVTDLGVERFGEWCVSLQTPEQRKSGGHVNPVTGASLARDLASAGFRRIRTLSNRVSEISDIASIERTRRSPYSLYVEAVA